MSGESLSTFRVKRSILSEICVVCTWLIVLCLSVCLSLSFFLFLFLFFCFSSAMDSFSQHFYLLCVFRYAYNSRICVVFNYCNFFFFFTLVSCTCALALNGRCVASSRLPLRTLIHYRSPAKGGRVCRTCPVMHAFPRRDVNHPPEGLFPGFVKANS